MLISPRAFPCSFAIFFTAALPPVFPQRARVCGNAAPAVPPIVAPGLENCVQRDVASRMCGGLRALRGNEGVIGREAETQGAFGRAVRKSMFRRAFVCARRFSHRFVRCAKFRYVVGRELLYAWAVSWRRFRVWVGR
jgi:hypothetical protein